MGIRPDFITVLDMPLRVYSFETYSTVYLEKGDKRLGNVSKTERDGVWQTEAGFAGTHRECVEQLVRRHRISNPGQVQGPDSPPATHRKQEMTVLGEKIWLYAFLQTPNLAVWADAGPALGILEPAGEQWQRCGKLDEPQSLEDCLEGMVRDYHEATAAQGVTCV